MSHSFCWYMRGKYQLECLPFMVCTFLANGVECLPFMVLYFFGKWENKLYNYKRAITSITFSVEPSLRLSMPLGIFPLIYICCSFRGHSICCFFPTLATCLWPGGVLSDLIRFPFLVLLFLSCFFPFLFFYVLTHWSISAVVFVGILSVVFPTVATFSAGEWGVPFFFSSSLFSSFSLIIYKYI